PAPECEGGLEWADQHRHDRGGSGTDVEAEREEALLQATGIVPEAIATLRLVLQHLQRREHAGGVGWRQRGREDERPRVMLEVVDHLVVAGDESANRGERLREGRSEEHT